MEIVEIVDLSSDDEGAKVGPRAVQLDSDFVSGVQQQHVTNKGHLPKHQRSRSHSTRQNSEENISSSGPNACHSYSGVLEQALLPVDNTGLSYLSPICAALLCRKFWKAGNYDNGLVSKVRVPSNQI